MAQIIAPMQFIIKVPTITAAKNIALKEPITIVFKNLIIVSPSVRID